MSITPTSGEGSKKLTVSWSGLPPATCTSPSGPDPTWGGTWRLQLHRVDGAVQGGSCTTNNTSSFTPSSSTLVTELPATVTSYTDLTHRADKDFRYLLIACEASGCASWYDDDTDDGSLEATSGDENWNCTQPERWRLVGIENLTTDTDRANADGSASAALFYPGGFYDGSTDLNRYLGFWWSSGGTSPSGASKADIIYYKRAGASGPQTWNGYASWVYDDTEVAEETGGSNDFSDLSHPWVTAASDATHGDRIEMWLRRNYGAQDNHTIGTRSSDEPGADFELECTDSGNCAADGDTCAYLDYCDYDDISADGGGGEVVICADGTSTCVELVGARHGRIMWDYVNAGAVDFDTDTPRMLFTGDPDGVTCARPGGSGDDLYVAEWDPVNDLWVVEDDGGSPACPEAQIVHQHDPGVIPLPGDDFKVYADANTSLKVNYWDESEAVWEDESSISVVLHDDTTTVSATCINNMDTLVYANAGTVVEMMFAQLATGGVCFTTGGIAYLELEN